jgi:hydrogenase large subunit
MARIVCDPVTRLEGHLGVDIEVGPAFGPAPTAFPATVGADTKVFSTMYRGLENILKGRDPRDAIQITQRVCGVCPVPHGTASTFAIENAMGFSPTAGTHTGHSSGPTNVARLCRNLTLGAEFMMSALTHFYALSALDLVQGPEEAPWTPYWDISYYDPALLNGGANLNLHYEADGSPTNIYTAVITDYVLALRMRTAAIDLGAIFGGRLPISSGYVAGGTTKLPTPKDITRARALLASVRSFIVNNYVPMTEIVSALHGLADNTNNNWFAALQAVGGLAGNTQALQTDTGNIRGPYSCTAAITNGIGIGDGCKNFYSAGGFDGTGNLNGGTNRLYPRGAIIGATDTAAGTAEEVDGTKIRESVKHAYYTQGTTADADAYENLYPGDGVTRPDATRTTAGYTWHKATRYSLTDITAASAVKEVGPLARMWVKGAAGGAVASDGYCAGQRKTMSKHAFASTNLHAGAPLPDLSVADYACGISLLDRHRARAREALLISAQYSLWLDELAAIIGTEAAPHTDWADPVAHPENKRFSTAYSLDNLTANGFGMTEAPRGSVHHWVNIKNGKIDNYQIIAPTTWNCSGRDSSDHPGPAEQALIGEPVRAVASGGKLVPVEALLVIHSFDPCIACSVHTIDPVEKTDMKKFIIEGGVE